MKRIAGAALFTAACLAVMLAGFFFPPEIKDRPNCRSATGIGFGDTGRFILAQPFAATRDGLSGFGLAVNNPGGRTFELRVRDAAGAVMAKVTTGERMDGFGEMRFTPIPDSAGKRYTLELEALDAGPRMAFFGAKAAGGELTANGAPTGAELFIQPLIRVTAAQRTRLLVERVSLRKPFAPGTFVAMNLLLIATLFAAAFFIAGGKRRTP